MRAFKALLVSMGLLCLGSPALAQSVPWENQIAVYNLGNYGIHFPYFLVGSTFYDVNINYVSGSNQYIATLGNYGLSAPGTPDPAYYSVLAGSLLFVPVLQVGSVYYEAQFVVISTAPYTFQLISAYPIPRPDPDPDPSPACGFVPQSDPKLAGLIARIQAKLSTDVAVTSRPSGANVAVVHNGQLISAEGVGMRSKATYGKENEPVDRETLFWIASTSKFMTATGAMTLVDDGLLNLFAPVTTYLPSYVEQAGQQGQITMDNLLEMKSGLPTDGGCNLFSVSASVEPNGCALVASSLDDFQVLENLFSPAILGLWPWSFFNTTSNGAPGSAPWTYSNWGFILVGRVMEAISGKQFPQLMQDKVFGPASMCLATYNANEVIAGGNYAIGSGSAAPDGYCPEPELGNDSYAPWMPDELACPARSPNGGVRASAIDMGNFAAAILGDLGGNHTILSQSAASQLLFPSTGRASTGGSSWGDTYGYGNFHHTYSGYDIYTHGGGRPGFGTLFWIIPSQNFAIAVANNFGSTTYFTAELEYAVRCYLDDLCD